MKRKIFAFAIIFICLAIITSSTIAYFTAKGVAKNTITSGGVNVRVLEWQDDNGKLVPYPKEAVEIMPSDEISKVVTILNDGSDCYVRTKIVIVIKDSNGDIIKEVPFNEYEDITLDINDTNWIKNDKSDEWWYYNEIVPKNKETKPLFTTILFNGDSISDEYKNTTLEVKVKAQAVQSANNGDNVLEANGWPLDN